MSSKHTKPNPSSSPALAALRKIAIASWAAGLPREAKGDVLWRALGYASRRTFEQAVETGSVEVRLHRDARTGVLKARAVDVAAWAWREFIRMRTDYENAAIGRPVRRGGTP